MNTRRLIGLCVVVCMLSISCNNNSDSSEETGDQFPDELQRVWQDATEDDGDELGVYFDDTSLYLWDYFGDSFDQGEDCYETFKTGDLISYEGDIYRIRSIFNNQEITARIVVDGDNMTVSDPGEGGDSSNFTADSRSVSELTPVCQAKSPAKRSLKDLSEVLGIND